MIPKRFSVKILIEKPEGLLPYQVAAAFQRYIQQASLEGLLIDVADYAHVHQAPTVLLVGHEGDYVLDESYGQAGVQYIYKHISETEFSAALVTATRRALQLAGLLANEPLATVQADSRRLEIALIDRLKFPNSAATFEALRPTFEAFGQQVYGAAFTGVALLDRDPREPLTVQITASAPLALATVTA